MNFNELIEKTWGLVNDDSLDSYKYLANWIPYTPNNLTPADPGLPTGSQQSTSSVDPNSVANGTTGVYSPDDKDAELWWGVAREVEQRVAEAKSNTTCGAFGHTWVRYNGFSESYDFCTKCDAKQEI